MGQKVNPIGFRTGIVMGWKSRWYASKKEFAELLVEDQKIRKFIKFHPTKSSYREAGIDRIEIERTRDEVRLMVFVAKPGLIIGKKGTEIEVLQEELQNLIGRRVNLKVEEVYRPEIQAQLIAEDIAKQLAKRSRRWIRVPRASRSRCRVGWVVLKWLVARRVMLDRYH
jgi:small subunit ribosomal protein S3